MRVCLITTFPPSRHHLSEYGFHLADEFLRQNIEFTILGDEYASEQVGPADQVELPGFSVRRCWRVGDVGNGLRILSAVREIRPDIVWFNLVYSTFGTNPLAAFAGLCIPALVRAAGFRTHVTLHHLMALCDMHHADISFPRVYRFAGSIATRLLLRADSVSVLLERYKRMLEEEYGARNIGVRPHGTLGAPHPPDLASRPPGEFRMLAFGKWGRYKRLETPLEALSSILSAVPNASLLIAGCDHPNRSGYLAALKEKWGAHPQIKFLGYLEEGQLDEVFRTAHVAVMPYLSSGGPSGVAHIAARFGLPIVAAEVDDFVRLAEEEGLAIDTYQPGDSAHLASRLIALAHDPARQARMAEQNYKVAAQSTMPRIVASYVTEFNRLLGEAKQVPTAVEGEATAASRHFQSGASRAGTEKEDGLAGRSPSSQICQVQLPGVSVSPHRLTFVIPAYNEAIRLAPTLNAIAGLSASHLGECEIVVVDDGSTDDTADIARAFRAPHCRVSVLSLPHRGKGAAIRHGVGVATGEIVILCDADLQVSVREVLSLLVALKKGADIAIGSRWLAPCESRSAQPFHRRVASRIYNLVAGHVLALPFRDTQCGLKALTLDAATRIFPLLNLDGWGYDSELIHVALTRNLRVEEVDLRLVHDYSNSHFRPLTDGWATLLELFEIRWNDLRGAYGRPALGPISFRETATLGLNFLEESTSPESLEVPANSPSDDLAA